METITTRILHPGEARGEVLYTTEPLSFWGGYDAATGQIIDRRHPLCGVSAAGKVLVFPAERGSSTASAVLLEAIRNKTAPAALVLTRIAPILTLGAIISEEMRGESVPILLVSDPVEFAKLANLSEVQISGDGKISF